MIWKILSGIFVYIFSQPFIFYGFMAGWMVKDKPLDKQAEQERIAKTLDNDPKAKLQYHLMLLQLGLLSIEQFTALQKDAKLKVECKDGVWIIK